MNNVVPFDPAHHGARPERNPAINTDMEQEVLAALLAVPAEIARLQTILKPEFFSEQLHQLTYAAMIEIAEADGLPTAGQLYQRLGPKVAETAITEDLNVRQYLAELARIGGMPGAPLLTHARMIRDLYILRHVEALGTEIGAKQGYDPCVFLDERFEKLDEVRALRMDKQLKTVTLSAAGATLMSMIEADLKGERPMLASTGITRFDAEIGGGLRPSSLTTLAARTSMGKSIVGLEVVLNSAKQGFGCIYHSLEMPKEQVMARLASSWLENKRQRIPFARIMAPKGLTPDEAQEVAYAIHELAPLHMMIEDGGGRTIQEIAVSSERLMNAYVRKGIQPGPIVIDHAHIVRPGRKYNREDEGLKEVADGSLALAKRLDVPVLLLAQCNRNTEGRDDKRPSLADVRGAGAFEENSDAVVFLYRPAYYIERSAKFREGDIATHDEYEAAKHALEIIIDKNRAGRSNQVVQAWVDPALNAVRNLQNRYGDIVMVAFYKHDIPAWMDGTEGLSDGTYRAYHVICQLIYLHEGPIMLNERGIAGRCNQSMKTFRKHLDELLALGKLTMVDGRIANARAAVELESVQKNRENAGKGGRNSGKSRENLQENSGDAGNSSGNAEREPDKLLKNNDAGEAALKSNRSLKEKKREEKTREEQHSVEVPETSDRKPALDERTLEAALRQAGGLIDDPSPNLFVVGPVHALISEGYDLERHILPVVRSLKAQGKRWSNWRYIVPAVREQNSAPATADKTHAAPAPVDEAKIRRGMISMAKGYLIDDRWSDSWGPRRGEAGCRIPEEIWGEAEAIVNAEKTALGEALRGKSNGLTAHH